jgi:hypothetical protein
MLWIAMEAIGKFQNIEKFLKTKILIILTTLTARLLKKIKMMMRAKQEGFKMIINSKITKIKIKVSILT